MNKIKVSFYNKHTEEHLTYNNYKDFLLDLEDMFKDDEKNGDEQFCFDMCLLDECEEKGVGYQK